MRWIKTKGRGSFVDPKLNRKTQQTDPNGKSATFSYDAANRGAEKGTA
jgi:RHS Repeat